MKILVTGSSGFVGKNLIRALEDAECIPYDVRDNSSYDVLDFERLRQTVAQVDGVVHLAAVSRVKTAYEDPKRCTLINVGGTTNVLEAVRQSDSKPWIIFTSSREVYGNAQTFPVTELMPRTPLNVYAAAKVAGEDLCRTYALNYGLRALIVRFSGVYTGPEDQLDRVIPCFILRALKKETLFIHGNGNHIFDFVYIDDVVDGLLKAIKFISSVQPGYIDDVNFVRNDPHSLVWIAERIYHMTGNSKSIAFSGARSYDVNRFWGDPAKAIRLFGYDPKTTLDEGLKRSIESLRHLVS